MHELILESTTLSLDQTKRINCPRCKGSDRTLAVTKRPGFLLYNCYRASCGARGRINIGCHSPVEAPCRRVDPIPYTPPLYPLAAKQLAYLARRYGLFPEELAGAKYNPKRGSVVYPIWDNRGVQIGVVDRSYTRARPKALTHFYTIDLPCTLHFPRPLYTADSLCIVEDIPSAIRLSRLRPTAALLGSHLSLANSAYLKNLTQTLIIALDPDAKAKAISLANSLRDLFSTQVLFLPRDPKDLTHEELSASLRGI